MKSLTYSAVALQSTHVAYNIGYLTLDIIVLGNISKVLI